MGGRRQHTTGRALAASVGWIIALLASYWLITGWENVPRIIASALA